jgi:hypothetical protein
VDEDWFEPEMLRGSIIYEDDPEPAQFTGLYASNGHPIYRVPVPRPSPKFVHFDPEEAVLYDFDVEDTYYDIIPAMISEKSCQN